MGSHIERRGAILGKVVNVKESELGEGEDHPPGALALDRRSFTAGERARLVSMFGAPLRNEKRCVPLPSRQP